MYCIFCGNKMRDGAKFCGACGAPVASAHAETPEQAEEAATSPELLDDGETACEVGPSAGGDAADEHVSLISNESSAASGTPVGEENAAAPIPPIDGEAAAGAQPTDPEAEPEDEPGRTTFAGHMRTERKRSRRRLAPAFVIALALALTASAALAATIIYNVYFAPKVEEPDMPSHAPIEQPAEMPAAKPEPVAQPEPETVAQPEPETTAQPKPEPVAQPEPEPVTQPKPEPEPAVKPEAAVEPTPEPVAEEPQRVWVEEQGHYEHVLVKEAWDEPVYGMVKAFYVHCICGYEFDKGDTESDYEAHLQEHRNRGDDESEYGIADDSYYEEHQVDTIHHDAVYEDRWVVDVPGHWE